MVCRDRGRWCPVSETLRACRAFPSIALERLPWPLPGLPPVKAPEAFLHSHRRPVQIHMCRYSLRTTPFHCGGISSYAFVFGLQYFVMGSSSVRYLLALLGRTRSIEMDCHCYYGSEKGKYNEGLVLKKGKRTRRKQI